MLPCSGGSRHLVWGGPRGAEGAEVEHRRREDQGAEGAELGRVRGGGVPFLTGGGVWGGPSPQIFLIFYVKRRVLVHSDVLNEPVTRRRA